MQLLLLLPGLQYFRLKSCCVNNETQGHSNGESEHVIDHKTEIFLWTHDFESNLGCESVEFFYLNYARDIIFKGLFSNSCPSWLMQIASRLDIRVQDVENVIIWGNHSSTQYPDVNHGTVSLPHKTPIRQAVKDDDWLNGAFVTVRRCSVTCSIVMKEVLSVYSPVLHFAPYCASFHVWLVRTH